MNQSMKKTLFTVLTSVLFASSINATSYTDSMPHTLEAGTLASASEVNENFTALLSKAMPIGSIVAWHKDFSDTATVDLPDNWVICDGRTITVEGSPFNGMATPDLNGNGRFLRGGSVSGVEQEDAFESHVHQTTPGAADGRGSGDDTYGVLLYKSESGVFGGYTQPAGSASETRPINMSVVWIMRIK